MPSRGDFLKYWLPVLVWMLVIFLASTSLGSGANTSRILGPMLNFLFPDITPETIAGIRMTVRKLGHFVEYAVLAGLLWRAFFRPCIDRPWHWPAAGCSVVTSIVYAVSDEFHQTFVPGRVGSPVDVIIDSIGATCGLAFLWLWWNWKRAKRQGLAS